MTGAPEPEPGVVGRLDQTAESRLPGTVHFGRLDTLEMGGTIMTRSKGQITNRKLSSWSERSFKVRENGW